MKQWYQESRIRTKRIIVSTLNTHNLFIPRIVQIGDISLGGTFPVLLQSMTNTNTLDTKATVAQAIRIYKAGGHLVRITVPGIREAENLIVIKKEIKKQGYKFPLIADVHFNPAVAEYCARIVEKVRINPGNYTDKKSIGKVDYTQSEYNAELEKISKRISPLLRICKEHGTALRIGSNHGSLSDRIMNRYGDTPAGMAESAMEFLRACADHDFYNIVVSMKASNIRIMVQATRLFIQKMMHENLCFPVHLGVTEAGESEDGRIKSAIGIGSLLSDGIGDTIRVSLTEAPENEIPVAKTIVKQYVNRSKKSTNFLFTQTLFDPFVYNKRDTIPVENIGGNYLPVVIGDFSKLTLTKGKLNYDYIFSGKQKNDFSKHPEKRFIVDYAIWLESSKVENIFPFFSKEQYLLTRKKSSQINFVEISSKEKNIVFFKKIKADKSIVLLLKNDSFNNQRMFFLEINKQNIHSPVIVSKSYNLNELSNFYIESACNIGPLFTDGLCDGILLKNNGRISRENICKTAFGILQATQVRISKTEFISCPTCGRTQFDITGILSDIKRRTSHMKGLKIAVMGCVVNGPGEMADADYGCVGSGIDKVNIYKGKVLIKKNVDAKNAAEELLRIIQESTEERKYNK